MAEVEQEDVSNEGYTFFGGGALLVSMLTTAAVSLLCGIVILGVVFPAYELLHAYSHLEFHEAFGELTKKSLLQYSLLAILALWVLQSAKTFAQHWFRCYRVDDHGLHLKSGVLWKKYTVVPKNRMQHADLKQGFFENLLELNTIVIHTAASSSPNIVVRHLPKAKGELLVRELVDYIRLRID